MTKQEWRQGDGNGEIEGSFEGEWIHLANVGGMRWIHPDDSKNERYQAWRNKALTLMLEAPALLALCKTLVNLVNQAGPDAFDTDGAVAAWTTSWVVDKLLDIIAEIETDK